MDRLRRLLVELRPRALEREGLGAALEQYARMVEEEGRPQIRVEDRRMGSELAPDVRMLAYRIARDAISNARAYAGAEHVDVTLDDRDDGVLVRVADGGRGFVEADVSEEDLLDLASMRERAVLGGGWLEVSSRLGHGTSVDLWIPRSRPEPDA